MYTQMTSCSCFSSLKGRQGEDKKNECDKKMRAIYQKLRALYDTNSDLISSKKSVLLLRWWNDFLSWIKGVAPKIPISNTTKIRENPTQVQQTISSEVIFQSQFKPTWKESAQHQFQRYLKWPFPSFQTAPRLQDYKGPDKKNTDTKNKFIQIQIQMLNIGKPNFTFQKTDSKNKTKAGFQTKNTSQKKY